jgi:hypothetical protein
VTITTTTPWRDQVPATTAAQADHWQGQIHAAVAASVMITGQALRWAKEVMPHGAFKDWWTTELRLRDSKQVSDLMNASILLEQHHEKQSLMKVPPRTLAILQKSGSPEAMEEAIERLENGERITEAEMRRIAANRKPKGGRIKESQRLRLIGVLDDERVAILSNIIKKRDAHFSQADKIYEALVMMPSYSGLTKDEVIAMPDDNGLITALKNTVREGVEAENQKRDLMDIWFNNRVALPDYTSELWALMGVEGSEIRQWQTLMRQKLVAVQKSLKDCKNPVTAFANYLEELQTDRGDFTHEFGTLQAHCMDTWSEWAVYYIQWWDAQLPTISK